jgi:hypothetical protein
MTFKHFDKFKEVLFFSFLIRIISAIVAGREREREREMDVAVYICAFLPFNVTFRRQ